MSAHDPSTEHRHARSASKSSQTTLLSTGRKRYLNYLLGIALLLAVVFLWTSSNFITQALFEGGYEKAFLVTYLNTSSFSLYIIPYLFTSGLSDFWRKDHTHEYEPLAPHANETEPPHSPTNPDQLPPLTTKETAKLAAIFCLFWFIANWTVNLSVDFTSVASATILASMSGFFIMIIGRIFRVEALTITKIGAVFMSLGGTILVALSDTESTPPKLLKPAAAEHTKSPLLGDALALISALFYAIYTITLKIGIKSESRIDMKLFFGFVGIFNLISLWPIALILHFTGLERLELPSTGKEVGGLLVNMAITWSSDFLYVLAMLKTTPLVATVGLSLTMPLAVVGDFLIGRPVGLQVIGGALLVLFSVVLVGMENARILKHETEAEDRIMEDLDRDTPHVES